MATSHLWQTNLFTSALLHPASEIASDRPQIRCNHTLVKSGGGMCSCCSLKEPHLPIKLWTQAVPVPVLVLHSS